MQLKIYENYETVLQMVLRKWKFQRKMERYLKLVSEQETWRVNFYKINIISLELINPGRCWQLQKKTCMRKQSAMENGRIQAVGTLDDVMQYKTDGDEMVDLQGKTMLPGFLDAHSHFVGAANAMTQCDLSECGNFSEIVDAMKMFAEKRNLSKDAWIVGCNYDQNFLEEKTTSGQICIG